MLPHPTGHARACDRRHSPRTYGSFCRMDIDVIDLKAFYADRLGRIAHRLILTRIRRAWPDLGGDRLVGVGYATPYLTPFAGESERCLAFMPAPQGIMQWPPDAPNAAALVHTEALPLDNSTFNRVLLVHCLEHAESPHETLREMWRVLAPGGRMMVVVPSRVGLWARTERTPFGHGRPFSRAQIARLLSESMFEPVSVMRALALPPVRSRLVVHNGASWERIGGRLWPRFSGVLIVEATKLVRQRIKTPVRQIRTHRVLSPALVPTAGLRPQARV